MRVTRLTLANVRAIERAEFRFRSGFNLIVGVNGVGKSTVLDALRISMSRILPSLTRSRAKAMSFDVADIRSGFPFLEASLSFEENGQETSFTRRQWRQTFAADDAENIKLLRRQILDSDRLRDRARNLLRELDTSQGVADTDSFFPSRPHLAKSAKESRGAPNCIYFSTNRSIPSNATASKAKTSGGEAAAYAEALAPRPLYTVKFADWMRAQGALAVERRVAKRHLNVLRTAVRRFLPHYANLRCDPGDEGGLVIDHTGMTLNVVQLSDGERGVLALVLDLARRLSQANPRLADPLHDGGATVLIDELDLHLHPTWQRSIIGNLTEVFPRCQFIATTHSPQVVAAVEPEQILLMTGTEVVHPDRSFGMDSNWILRYLMETDERPAAAARAIKTVEGLIQTRAFNKARIQIAKAKTRGFDLPEWSVLEARMARLTSLH
jgi:predicted ATP-binding protein involved in virulence